FDDVARSDCPRIGDVVGSERRALLPKIDTGADEITAMGERVYIVVNLWVVLDFRQIVTRVVKFIKRNPKPPDIALVEGAERLLSEGLGAAVKAARGRVEREIGVVKLGESIKPLGMIGEQLL